MKKPFKKILRFSALSAALLLSLEFFYFYRIFHASAPPGPVGMVLVFSGNEGRLEAGLARSLELKSDYLFFSGWDKKDTRRELRRIGFAGKPILVLEERARTTDQNARYGAPLIKAAGVKTAALVLPWYHLPRALFLTRFYLWGSGITVAPLPAAALPADWMGRPVFYAELLKFWGSLGRIALSLAGIENWPPARGSPPPRTP